ncbi:hypothetical protein EX30DRAFT_192231, partial [Ascodesmis nigricans]
QFHWPLVVTSIVFRYHHISFLFFFITLAGSSLLLSYLLHHRGFDTYPVMPNPSLQPAHKRLSKLLHRTILLDPSFHYVSDSSTLSPSSSSSPSPSPDPLKQILHHLYPRRRKSAPNILTTHKPPRFEVLSRRRPLRDRNNRLPKFANPFTGVVSAATSAVPSRVGSPGSVGKGRRRGRSGEGGGLENIVEGGMVVVAGDQSAGRGEKVRKIKSRESLRSLWSLRRLDGTLGKNGSGENLDTNTRGGEGLGTPRKIRSRSSLRSLRSLPNHIDHGENDSPPPIDLHHRQSTKSTIPPSTPHQAQRKRSIHFNELVRSLENGQTAGHLRGLDFSAPSPPPPPPTPSSSSLSLHRTATLAAQEGREYNDPPTAHQSQSQNNTNANSPPSRTTSWRSTTTTIVPSRTNTIRHHAPRNASKPSAPPENSSHEIKLRLADVCVELARLNRDRRTLLQRGKRKPRYIEGDVDLPGSGEQTASTLAGLGDWRGSEMTMEGLERRVRGLRSERRRLLSALLAHQGAEEIEPVRGKGRDGINSAHRNADLEPPLRPITLPASPLPSTPPPSPPPTSSLPTPTTATTPRTYNLNITSFSRTHTHIVIHLSHSLVSPPPSPPPVSSPPIPSQPITIRKLIPTTVTATIPLQPPATVRTVTLQLTVEIFLVCDTPTLMSLTGSDTGGETELEKRVLSVVESELERRGVVEAVAREREREGEELGVGEGGKRERDSDDAVKGG